MWRWRQTAVLGAVLLTSVIAVAWTGDACSQQPPLPSPPLPQQLQLPPTYLSTGSELPPGTVAGPPANWPAVPPAPNSWAWGPPVPSGRPEFVAAHVPPNGAQVLPDVNFQHFPMAPPAPSAELTKLKAHKDGFFQRASLMATWLDRGDQTSLGVTEVELYATGAIPWPSREQPMLLTPGFNMRFFDAPPTPDLPETVYDAYLQWMWLPRWNDRWSGIVAVTPGVYSDFETYSSDALRITGRGLVRWQMVPELEALFGVLYLNRTDLNWLPAAGLIWTPHEDARFDLVFPRPKLGWRFAQQPGYSEDWVYLGGEFGGDTWLVERAAGTERITMRDWRIYLGAERKLGGGAGVRFETGYVFSRAFEFESTPVDYEPDDTVMVRLGGSY